MISATGYRSSMTNKRYSRQARNRNMHLYLVRLGAELLALAGGPLAGRGHLY